MEPISSKEYQLSQGRGIARPPVSTISGPPETAAVKGLLSTLGDSWAMLEGTYDRGPGWVMSGIQKAPIPSKFAAAANEVKRSLYGALKDTYRSYDDQLTMQIFDPKLTDEEFSTILGLKRDLRNTYKSHIRGIKSTPDTLLSKIESYAPVTGKDANTILGSWDQGVKELKLNQKVAPNAMLTNPDVVEKKVQQVVPHEMTHNFQQNLFEAVRNNENAPEIVRNLPKEYREVVFNNELLTGHHLSNARLTSPKNPSKTAYKDFYSVRPFEAQAREAAKLKDAFVTEVGRVPTMQETFMLERDAQKKVLDAWKRTAPKTYEKARQEAVNRIQLKYDIVHKF